MFIGADFKHPLAYDFNPSGFSVVNSRIVPELKSKK